MTVKTRWIDFLYRTATGSRKIRYLYTPVGALIYGSFIVLFMVASLVLDRWLQLPTLIDKPLNLIISLPVLGFSIVMIGWSVAHFMAVKGTPVPLNPPPKLVNTGPYAVVRNPMLTGVFGLLFGVGFWYGSVFLTLFFAPLFTVLNVWELKAIEEPELIKRLGADYIEYREMTPMFFPAIRKKDRHLSHD
ncbi:MAG: isoprenylcysteine carboxylmethyltransferase family protein [Desulfobacteraceae bacterium]|nr:isoprenylcysteine carboxylmethyltransferase family protein [Desulfobacteraceae bacterium]